GSGKVAQFRDARPPKDSEWGASVAVSREAPGSREPAGGTMADDGMACSRCLFYLKHQGEDDEENPHGEFRRLPPTVRSNAKSREHSLGIWPIVLADDWCGEYEATGPVVH